MLCQQPTQVQHLLCQVWLVRMSNKLQAEQDTTIILYANGTALFSTYSGTWAIDKSTTFEGIYSVRGLTQDDYFTITNNGFTAVQTGNVYVKTTSATSSPTASASASPTTSATSTPKVPEFSNATLILVAAAMAVVTLGAVVLTKRPRKQLRK